MGGLALPRLGQASRAPSSDSSDDAALAPPDDLIDFLNTAPGARWLTDILLEWPGQLHNLRRATLAEVNAFVLARYRDFIGSDLGQRMLRAPQHRSAAAQDTLALPVYLVEDLVRQRLATKITRNWWAIGVFLATRTPLMCAAVHAAKAGARRLLRLVKKDGRAARRLVAVANFVLDELVPTGFYGPLLAYGLLAHRMVRELSEN